MQRTTGGMRPGLLRLVAGLGCAGFAGTALAAGASMSYAGKPVRIGHGSAHTVVEADASGKATAVGVVFSAGVLDGLPKAKAGQDPDFPYRLPMPAKGPKTVVNHVVVNWESQGHPPEHVYDVPHFDFHFYFISAAERKKIHFDKEEASGDPSQQPPAALLPPGYVVPPGTAVSEMGVHAVNPGAGEFHQKPFDVTLIYGYFDQRLSFVEPMASVAYLKTQPSFAAPVPRPARYSIPGAYPSSYGVSYDAAKKSYAVMLSALQ